MSRRRPLALVKHKRTLDLEGNHIRRQNPRFTVKIAGYAHTGMG